MSLWIQVDKNHNLLQGPTFLTGELLRMDIEDLNGLGWYTCTAPNIDYDPRYAIQVGYDFYFDGNQSVVTFTNVWRELDYLKSLRREDVNHYRDQWMDGGWIYDGIGYDSDPYTRQNMSGTMTLIQTGYTLPDDFTWRTADNHNIPYDNESFTTFYQQSCRWMEAVYRISWYHKAQIDAQTTPEAVVAYNITLGWPTTAPE